MFPKLTTLPRPRFRLAAQSRHYTGQELLDAQELLEAAQEEMVRSARPKRLILEILILRVLGRPSRRSTA